MRSSSIHEKALRKKLWMNGSPQASGFDLDKIGGAELFAEKYAFLVAWTTNAMIRH
jgi:hypothetical protein